MKVPTTMAKLQVKVFPDRLNISLTRFTAARWTATAAKFAIGSHRTRTTLAEHSTGAMRLFAKGFIKVVFEYRPSSKRGSYGDERMNHGGNFPCPFAHRTAAGCAPATLQMVVRGNNLLSAHTLQAASASLRLPILPKKVVLENRQATENGSDGDKRMSVCIGSFSNRFSSA